jgi:hypothetical protein
LPYCKTKSRSNAKLPRVAQTLRKKTPSGLTPQRAGFCCSAQSLNLCFGQFPRPIAACLQPGASGATARVWVKLRAEPNAPGHWVPNDRRCDQACIARRPLLLVPSRSCRCACADPAPQVVRVRHGTARFGEQLWRVFSFDFSRTWVAKINVVAATRGSRHRSSAIPAVNDARVAVWKLRLAEER